VCFPPERERRTRTQEKRLQPRPMRTKKGKKKKEKRTKQETPSNQQREKDPMQTKTPNRFFGDSQAHFRPERRFTRHDNALSTFLPRPLCQLDQDPSSCAVLPSPIWVFVIRIVSVFVNLHPCSPQKQNQKQDLVPPSLPEGFSCFFTNKKTQQQRPTKEKNKQRSEQHTHNFQSKEKNLKKRREGLKILQG